MAKRNRGDERREALRERHWPKSGDEIWKGPDETGYGCLPRTLPMILQLAADKKIVGSADCGRVYLELLSRDRGQGVVAIESEGKHAFYAGYASERAVRTWRERVRALARAGFIRVEAAPNQSIGVVLIRHPHLVVTDLRAKELVSDEWWKAYEGLVQEVGASKPRVRRKAKSKAEGLTVIRGGRKTKRTKKSKAAK